MLTAAGIGLAAPWALAALVALPALWWLLRMTPPAPRQVPFPPLRLLQSLASREVSAVHTPWWLLALRILLAALLILAAAGPVLNAAGKDTAGDGPLILVVDDGWAAGPVWPDIQAALAREIARADRDGRAVAVVGTAAALEEGGDEAPRLSPAGVARDRAQALQPRPWPVDRTAAVDRLLAEARAGGWPAGRVVWLSDGLDQPAGAEPAAAWLDRLGALGTVSVLLPAAGRLPRVLLPVERTAQGSAFTVVRGNTGQPATGMVRTLDEAGAVLGRTPFSFDADAPRAVVRPDLPTEAWARLARIEIEAEPSAAAVLLADELWRRRSVGLFGEAAGADRPLLGAEYYLERALAPFADVHRDALEPLLARPLSMLVLSDVGTLEASQADAVLRWVEEGGVLLRFAGPRLARGAEPGDPLLPIALRPGERTLGGTLSWQSAPRLAPFDRRGPFAGLVVPDDLQIFRQIIAEPSLDAGERTWAALQDGTPLITGAPRGRGWVVLMHTTASPDWSNLPLSGLFEELLRRLISLGGGSAGTGGEAAAILPPFATLDGFGRQGPPPPGTRSLEAGALATTPVGPRHPPGLYGSEQDRRALNLGPQLSAPRPVVPQLPQGVVAASLSQPQEVDLRGWLFAAALILASLDFAISLRLRGLLRLAPMSARADARLLLLALAAGAVAAGPGATPASAQQVVADGTAVPASLMPRLAFVRTGDAGVDRVSDAGLAGLTAVVNRRTAADLAAPVGVDPERDELLFYPFLYWPVAESLAVPSPAAQRRLIGYMRGGGTIVFDTRGRQDLTGGLRQLARVLDLPPLVAVAPDHVLGRSYYLLTEFPGRRAAAPVWVEQVDEHVNDGVSAVIAGTADWAGAWAVDTAQRPLQPVVPGGERQRELAFRFGVNVVMYTLTGNYKADQVHLPTILERLGS